MFPMNKKQPLVKKNKQTVVCHKLYFQLKTNLIMFYFLLHNSFKQNFHFHNIILINIVNNIISVKYFNK